jgi:hypothetical protein
MPSVREWLESRTAYTAASVAECIPNKPQGSVSVSLRDQAQQAVVPVHHLDFEGRAKVVRTCPGRDDHRLHKYPRCQRQ